MAKTIQIRVDDDLKDNVDALFTSLGLDTSTAVRMFSVAAMMEKGLPFDVKQRANIRKITFFDDGEETLQKSMAQQEAGTPGYSLDEFYTHMKRAIARGAATNV